MSLLAVGINHKTAPVEIRERVSFAPERLADALHELTSTQEVSEAAILSTCNRTELVCCSNQRDGNTVIDWFEHYHKLSDAEVRPYLYVHPDQLAVRHVLRVASGLDSLILGEPQILGQIKDAYSKAQQAGTVGKLLSRLFQHTFSVAKQVRTDTAIGSSPVSVAFAAVSLAKQIFSGMEEHTALLIGAGETIELAARHLHASGIGRMIIANRTVEKAHTLAQEFDAYAIALGEIPHHLAEADIVISSTASQLPILGKGATERAIKARKHRPMLMIDIAVPRDIEPEVGAMEDIYLYTVDDLQEIIEEGLKSRQEAAEQAEEIIDTQVAHFMGWLQSLSAVDTICQFRDHAMGIREAEVAKAMQRLANGADAEQVLQKLAHNLTNKLTHAPSAQLRQAGFDGRDEILDAARLLFQLKKTQR
ncbi:glutamyl-tRNA reductase [Candidatus Tenderia electrophaga]|jgi:glutamyl-tRNA reductase|uniref:Glutamyl-tRNA reductase n=1 Tax=Candidatus Tenderia electrophaga TaxID=1748243 RepID=A0A0S2TGV0_9GAMM|nr:glutamyl-tRNA reductase [Candidatus Tenderia electrophaga]